MIRIENFLSGEEVREIRGRLGTADWRDGTSTAGSLAGAVKKNLQLEEDCALATELGNQILRKLGNHPVFISAALPRKIHPPRFNRYANGGTYGSHVDSALMHVRNTNGTMRSDLSATLFLSAPDEYQGGELEIESRFGVRAVKLKAGDLILYPSNSLHRVTPVTAGARIASVFWIESLVRDDAARALLFELDRAIQGLTPVLSADDLNLVNLTGVYHNLIRRWAVT